MFRKIADLQSEGKTSVLVTITNTKGSTPREVGAKMLVTRDKIEGTIGGGTLEWLAIERARGLLESCENSKWSVPLCSKAHQCCGGFVELFFDIIKPRPRLLIFGAGHVGQALLEVMAGTQYECKLVDERSQWIEEAQRKRFQLSHLALETFLKNPVEWFDDNPGWNFEETYAIVMTHDHGLDEAILEKLLGKPLRFLGLIGSQTKRQRFFSRLLEKGFPQSQLEKISCPVGLPIGGKAPKEVALSIGAELVQLYFLDLAKQEKQRVPVTIQEIQH
ncbi:MAG: xanthine dehydrogenase accessory protein XdhC [Pseudobdellovibrionaceae bacterium]